MDKTGEKIFRILETLNAKIDSIEKRVCEI